MTYLNNSGSELVFREISFRITIGRYTDPAETIRTRLLEAINQNQFGFKSFAIEGITLQQFFRRKLEQAHLPSREGKIYLVNYAENEGSLIIEVTFLVITTFVAYGSIRQTIDYLLNDLESIIRNRTNYDVDVQLTDEKDAGLREDPKMKTRMFRLSPAIRTFILFIVSLLTGAFLTYYPTHFRDEDPTEAPATAKQIEELIDRKVDQAVLEAKVEQMYHRQPVYDITPRQNGSGSEAIGGN